MDFVVHVPSRAQIRFIFASNDAILENGEFKDHLSGDNYYYLTIVCFYKNSMAIL